MKILFFVHSLASGGAERVTATLANHWALKGWQVSVVSIDAVEADFYALDNRIRRIPLRMAAHSQPSMQGVMGNLRRVRALWSILRRERPDVAVAMMSTPSATLALAGRLAGVPSIGSERIHPPALPLGRAWETVRKRTYPLLAGFVAQTRDSATWLSENAGARNIAVIPNPVEFPLSVHAPRLSPSTALASFRGGRMLLAVGRLEPQKGFDRLLSAFASLAARHPDWVLVVLGRGSLGEALKQQAIDLGIGGRVILPGAVGNLGEWYEAADLYALTSRFEGFPNTLLEAMAYGRPAVAVDCETGPREIMRNEVDGILVPQADSDALVAGMDRMMSDANLRKQCAERAIEVRERFSVEQIARQWETLFTTVV